MSTPLSKVLKLQCVTDSPISVLNLNQDRLSFGDKKGSIARVGIITTPEYQVSW